MMHRLFRRSSRRAGLPPGTLPIPSGQPLPPTTCTLVRYNNSQYAEEGLEAPEHYQPAADKTTVTWLQVQGVHDASIIAAIGDRFQIHPLVLEDIMNTEHRVKVEDFDEYLFLVLKPYAFLPGEGRPIARHVCLLLLPGVVISFQESGPDIFAPVQDRLKANKGRIRRSGADYLAYALLDVIVDGYFAVLEHVGSRIEDVDAELLDGDSSSRVLQDIRSLKHEAADLRRSVWPLRGVVSQMEQRESALITAATHIYLRDAYDHAMQIMETVETFREMLSGMMEMHLSAVSNRMNQVMKVLTIIATIFIPLTFIAGIYGMNFAHMPELGWRWGYPAALGSMLAVGIAMIFYFLRKDWL